MVTKEQFIDFHKHHKEFMEEVDKIEGIFGHNFGDCQLCEHAYWIFDLFMESNFTEKGRDVYYAWMYEDMTEDDIDGRHYEFYTAEDVWSFLETQRT